MRVGPFDGMRNLIRREDREFVLSLSHMRKVGEEELDQKMNLEKRKKKN